MQFSDHGAFIISLDFELYWGVTDIYTPPSSYDRKVWGVYRVIPRLLALFEEFGISATWATVGMIFANSTADANDYSPKRRPGYKKERLSPYTHAPSRREDEKLFYAPDLVRTIARCPGQEIGTHTYSHFYCLEEGQTVEEFEADLVAAIRIAAKYDIRLRSLVFPRNQINPLYLDILFKHGIVAYRGSDFGWMNLAGDTTEQSVWRKRIARLADAYIPLSGDNTYSWSEVVEPNGLCNVRGSRYFRPHTFGSGFWERAHLGRIISGIESAARSRRLFHLWCHPEDLGPHLEENMRNMRIILEAFDLNRRTYGIKSLSMGHIAEALRPEARPEVTSRVVV
jgi:peptidoglycan/xylan/chitin deacetylase (PgdA/CDA1 family)